VVLMSEPKPRKPTTDRGILRPAAGVDISGAKLTRLRVERAWSREQLADRVGVKPVTISVWENGTRRPKIASFAALCEALGCQPADLLK
jgi:transcriptional regulator with XRE-family HTH domain